MDYYAYVIVWFICIYYKHLIIQTGTKKIIDIKYIITTTNYENGLSKLTNKRYCLELDRHWIKNCDEQTNQNSEPSKTPRLDMESRSNIRRSTEIPYYKQGLKTTLNTRFQPVTVSSFGHMAINHVVKKLHSISNQLNETVYETWRLMQKPSFLLWELITNFYPQMTSMFILPYGFIMQEGFISMCIFSINHMMMNYEIHNY